MNQRRRSPGPRVEPLEGRVVLSTMVHGPAQLIHGLARSVENGAGQVAHSTSTASHLNPILSHQPFFILNGQGQGTAGFLATHIADTGQTLVLKGSATLSTLGHVTLSGSISGTGFIQDGYAQGTITFRKPNGEKLTLHVNGPTQPGFTAPPEGQYAFTTLSGTGRFAHVSGSGQMNFLYPNGTFSMTFRAGPPPP